MALQEKNIKQGITVTWVGIGVNISLFVLKIYAGVIGRSQALIADGIHSLSDLLSDFITLLGLRWGNKIADDEHPFGHRRIETISALIIGAILVLVGAAMVYNSVISLYEHRESHPTVFTIIVASISIVVKEAMYWYTLIIGKRLKSKVLIGNAWHHRTDALSSVAVLIGVWGAYLHPNWHLADSLAALFVTYFIIRVGARLIWDSLKEVVDTAPDKKTLDEMEKIAQSIEGVKDAHDIRARYSGGQIITEIHIVVDPDLTVREGHAIAKRVELTLIEKIDDLVQVIVHVDPEMPAPSEE